MLNKIKRLNTADVILLFVAVFFDYIKYWPDGFMVFMSRSTHPVRTRIRATIGPLAKHHPNGVSLLRRVESDSRLDDGWAKVQPAVVLILKRLRRRGHSFNSHPIDWNKPGIEPGAPWFTRHMLPETLFSCLWPCSLAITGTGWMGLWLFMNIQCSTGSGSGF